MFDVFGILNLTGVSVTGVSNSPYWNKLMHLKVYIRNVTSSNGVLA